MRGDEVTGQIDVVQHGEDGDAMVAGEVAQQLHHRDLVAQVEVHRRLIEQQQPRFLRDGHGQHGQLAFAERQLADVAPTQSVDADPRERRIDRPRGLSRARPEQRVLVRHSPERNELLDAHGEGDRQSGRERRRSRRARAPRSSSATGRPSIRTEPTGCGAVPGHAAQQT